jgi:rod shape-determining protein MreD
MKRFGIFSLTLLTAVLLQTTVFSKLKILDVSPDLLLAVVICFALLEGPTVGGVLGFSGGFMRDLLLDAPMGLTGLAYLIVGYIAGSIRPYISSTSVFVPAACVFAGTALATGLYEIFQALLGQRTPPTSRAIQVVVLTALYNTILVPFIYPPVRRIVSFYRPERVYQW